MRRLLAALALTACKRDVPSVVTLDAAAPPVAAIAAPDAASPAPPRWVPRLDSEADFLRYSKEVGVERFTKFIVDRRTSAIYYVDAEIYPMHKDFVFAELSKVPRTKEAERAFDKNYGKDKPEYVLCYLVHHLEPNLWSFAFWDGDKATAEHVQLAYRRMRETFYLAAEVKFRPNSNEQEAVARALDGIPLLTNDELYQRSGYQPFHLGRAVGKLRVVPAGADFESLSFARDEIVLLPGPLPDLTPVAGIVTEGFSSPLAHVNLRAGAWGIPNVAARDVMKKYSRLTGKTVVLDARASTYELREATGAEAAAAALATTDTGKVQVPRANLGITALTDLSSVRATDAPAFGAKTANLGEIVHAKLPGVVVPPGFGVPIAHYATHLERAGLGPRIEQMLVDPEFRRSAPARKAALASLRQAILDAPLDPAFVAALGAALASLSGDAGPLGVFVRSSTNAEDLPGFSGAGLYDTVPNARGIDAVAAAVKRVWASVWNLAAFEERELYRIDPRRVFGAVLVQVGIDASAAGVLLTTNPSEPAETHTFTINAKSGLGLRVVSGKKVPEIVLYNVHNKGLRVISRSGDDTKTVLDQAGGVKDEPIAPGQPVLTTQRVALLADAAQRLRGIFPKDRPLDVEWVFRGDELFIVQSRPYVAKNGPRPEAPP